MKMVEPALKELERSIACAHLDTVEILVSKVKTVSLASRIQSSPPLGPNCLAN